MAETKRKSILVDKRIRDRIDELRHPGQSFGGILEEILAFILNPEWETKYGIFNPFLHTIPKETREENNGEHTD